MLKLAERSKLLILTGAFLALLFLPFMEGPSSGPLRYWIQRAYVPTDMWTPWFIGFQSRSAGSTYAVPYR